MQQKYLRSEKTNNVYQTSNQLNLTLLNNLSNFLLKSKVILQENERHVRMIVILSYCLHGVLT